MKVTREVATSDINGWLDYKKVSEKKKELYQDSIESLIDAVCEGLLIVNDDKSLSQSLKFPIEGEATISNLTFKPRLKMNAIHMHLQNVKSGDADGRILAYISALTSNPKDVIKNLDTEDYAIGQAVAIFFL